MQAQALGQRPHAAEAAPLQVQRHRIARHQRHALRPQAGDALRVLGPLLALLGFALGGRGLHLPGQLGALLARHGRALGGAPCLADALPVAAEHAAAHVGEQLAPAGIIAAPSLVAKRWNRPGSITSGAWPSAARIAARKSCGGSRIAEPSARDHPNARRCRGPSMRPLLSRALRSHAVAAALRGACRRIASAAELGFLFVCFAGGHRCNGRPLLILWPDWPRLYGPTLWSVRNGHASYWSGVA